MRVTTPRVPVAIAVVAAVASAGLLAATPAEAANDTLTVNVAAPFRPVTHAASGGLYGLAENNRPSDSRLLPLKVNALVQPAPGVGQRPNGQPPGGDALLVSPQASRVGAAVYIRMPDIYPDFPYRWVSWSDWNNKVDKMVRERLAATSASNIAGWGLWNEPNWTWDSNKAGNFNEGWVNTFRRVRALDTLTPIVGPNIGGNYDEGWMRSFLTHAKNNNALPDIAAWHELSGPQGIASNIASYRNLERQLGITARPISISEYGTKDDEVDVPGKMVSYISKLERGGVLDAQRAFWFEYGTMNGLTTNDQPTGTYWLYKWYGDMAGNMVTTSPPSQNGMDGFAAYDPTRKIVNIVTGNTSGNNSVRVTGLNDLGSNAKVTIQSTPSNGRHTAVSAPTQVSSTTASISGGALTVSLPNMSSTSAYNIVIQPTSGVPSYQQRYEAENASVFRGARLSTSSASAGGYVGKLDNSGDSRTTSYVDFITNVPNAGTYTMKIGYANGGGSASTHGLAYNGGSWSTISYPSTGDWGKFGSTVSTTLNLKAGYNTIRLAKGSPNFAGGSGFAELDYIELTPGIGPTTTTTTTSGVPTTTTTTTTTSGVPTTTTTSTMPPPTTTTTTSGSDSAGCTAVYAVDSDWGAGFVSRVKVTVGNAPIQGWTVQLNLPSGSALTGIWNGVNSGTTGTISVANASYNGVQNAGGVADFGFQGSGTGAGGTVVSCTTH